MAKIIDGKKIAQEIRAEVAAEVSDLVKNGVRPHLSVVLVGENPASQVYVRMKAKACEEAGMSSETLTFPDSMSQDDLLDVLQGLNANHDVHGILVQLPLPSQIDENAIIPAVLPEKDVDGFHPVNVGKLASGLLDGFVPATPAGVVELLMRSGYPPQGRHVVIVGRSNLVGKPLGSLLLRKGERGNATVTFCHSRTRTLGEITKLADILVAAVGRPETITKNMVKPWVVVIDVGTNRVDDASKKRGYRLVGDVDFEGVSTVAGAITPVPGGVGPMTITMLLKNTLQAYKQQMMKE